VCHRDKEREIGKEAYIQSLKDPSEREGFQKIGVSRKESA